MYEKLIYLDAKLFKNIEFKSFIGAFSRMLYGNTGAQSQFSKQLPVQESDILRVFLGVPDTWLTDKRQRIIEATLAYTLNLPFDAYPDIWLEKPNWHIKNKKAVIQKDLGDLVLDVKFIDSFGLRQSVWEKEIFFTNGLFTRLQKQCTTKEQNFRLYMALILFGFSEPQQFFTKV